MHKSEPYLACSETAFYMVQQLKRIPSHFFHTGQNFQSSSLVVNIPSASTSQARTTSDPAGLATTISETSMTLSAPTQIPLTSTITLSAITPTIQAGSAVNNTTTVSNASGLNRLPSTPASSTSYITTKTTQSTSISAQTLSSNHVSHPIGTFETTVNHTTASSSAAPTVVAQVTNQTAVLRTMMSNALFTGTAIIIAF